MHADSPWVMIGYPLILVAPWIAGIVWLLRRTPGGDGMPAPSMGETLRRRLNL